MLINNDDESSPSKVNRGTVMFKSGLQLLESVAANMKMAPQFPPSARDNGSDDVRQISQPATITELPSDTAPEMTETQAVSEQHVEVVAKQQVESQLPTTVEITHTNDTPPVVAVRPISSDFDAELVACADEARLLESRLRHIVNHIQQHGVEAIREISLITDQPSNIEILDELYDVVFDYESSVGIVDMDAHRKSLAILNKACHLNVDIAMARSRLRYLSALEHSKVTSVDDQVVPASGPSIPPSLFSKLLDLAEEPIEKLQEIKKSQESETLVMAKQLAVARSTMLRPLLEEITVLERSMASQFGIEAAHNARIASLQAKSNEASVAVDDRQHLERQISQLELTVCHDDDGDLYVETTVKRQIKECKCGD